MIRWPFYPAEAAVYLAAFVASILISRMRLAGHQDISIVQVPIALKCVWAVYLCILALRAGGDFAPTHTFAAIHNGLTLLMGLCLAMLFGKRVVLARRRRE